MFLYRARSFHRSLRMQSMTLGLFTGMCYSHQTGLVKSQHVVLLPKHRGESEHQTDNLYLFHCQFTFRPSSWHPLPPTPPPTVSFFLTPHKSYCIWVTTAFNSLCHSSICTKWFGLVSGPKSLTVIHPARVSGQPACLSAPRVTTHESQESGNHVGPDVLPRFSQLVMPTHRSLVSAASAWPLFQRHYDMLAEALNNSQSSL